ncbi:SpoIIE family protein phosphatase [Desulfosarcina sp. OttesenSCG-928-G10]|nr:SpoIIE family protein phosphatase [Desulfosarcina sp. OttesenSCG-928-G10]
MKKTVFFMLTVLMLMQADFSAAAQRHVVVGMYQNAPLIFMDTDGQVKGILADLFSHIAQKENWTLSYLPGSIVDCQERLKLGTIDLIAGGVNIDAISSSLAPENPFLMPRESLMVNWGQLYIPSDAKPSETFFFNGQDVAVVEADPYFLYLANLLDKVSLHPNFIRVDSYEEVLSQVHQGKVAAGVVPRIFGVYAKDRFPGVQVATSFMPTELCVAMATEKNAGLIRILDRNIRELKNHRNSIFYESVDLWTHGVRKVTLPSWLHPFWLGTIITGVILLFMLASFYLRNQVKRKTHALKATIIEKEKITSELNIARKIQLQLLPQLPGPTSRQREFDIYAVLEPALEVGGDFYDYFFVDGNTLCIVIGDVSGKGVPAALFMAMTKTMIKSAARVLVEPAYIIADVNREICRNNPSMTFVTVFLGMLNLARGILTYTSAGHNPSLFIGRKGNSVFLSEAQCPAIGIDSAAHYTQATVQLRHKEGLLLFTDGVTEAMDARGTLFTQEALMNTISLTGGLPPKERIAAILARIGEFTGNQPQEDDMALLAITYFHPNGSAPHVKTLYLRNNMAEMHRIAEALTEVADSVACPETAVHDAMLAVEEMFSNIVFYAFEDGLGHTITFHIAVEDGTLILTLQDEGIAFNPLNAQMGPLDKPVKEHDKGGMGILLARNLTDRMVYRREQGKNILRMEKRYR